MSAARAALREIVEQGEGFDHQSVFDGDHNMFHPERDEVAHYFRFVELQSGRCFSQGNTPAAGPTGEFVDVDWDARPPNETQPVIDGSRPG